MGSMFGGAGAQGILIVGTDIANNS